MKKISGRKTPAKTIILFAGKGIQQHPGEVLGGTAEDKSHFNRNRIPPTIVTERKLWSEFFPEAQTASGRCGSWENLRTHKLGRGKNDTYFANL